MATPARQDQQTHFTHFCLQTEFRAKGSVQDMAKVVGMQLIARAATGEAGAAALDENSDTHDLTNATINGDGAVTKSDGAQINATFITMRIVM